MDKFKELTTGAKLVLGATVAFLIVSFFEWFEVSGDLGEAVEAFAGDNGVSMWNGVGYIAGLLAIALIVWQALRLANIELELGITPAMITAALAALTADLHVHPLDRRSFGVRPDDLGVAGAGTRDPGRRRCVDEHAGLRRGARRDQVLRRRRHGSCEGSGRPRRQAVRRHSRAAGCTCRRTRAAARPAGRDAVRHRGGTVVGAGQARRHTPGVLTRRSTGCLAS